jgi:hypothetical protein
MRDMAKSVRITADADCILELLTAKLRQPKAQVLEKALKELEERIFWSETAEAFATAGKQEPSQGANDTELWDRGTTRDFSGEEW